MVKWNVCVHFVRAEGWWQFLVQVCLAKANFSRYVVAINHVEQISGYGTNMKKCGATRCVREGFIYYTTLEIQVDQVLKGLV